MVSQTSPLAVASDWLDRLRTALSDPHPGSALTTLLQPDACFRDELCFSWSVRVLRTPEDIAAYVTAGLEPCNGTAAAGGLTDLILDERPMLAPEALSGIDLPGMMQLAWSFESNRARGRGVARLSAPTIDAPAPLWLANIVFFTLDTMKGHEEAGSVNGVSGHDGVEEVNHERRLNTERSPYVVVVGAGQSGLQVTARLQQLGVPTLLIERNARVGDTWRNRYDSLTLHTPREHHTLLYASYPEVWPKYTPKQQLGDWFEKYSVMHDLVVWTGTELLPDTNPTYNEVTHRWTMHITRNGQRQVLNPAHIILATGTLGAPNIPHVPGAELFRGIAMHSSAYRNGEPFRDQRILVVGTGNTGADICGDLVGAQATVTLLQRSPTVVAFQSMVHAIYDLTSPPGVPPDIADLRYHAVPAGLRVELFRQGRLQAKAAGIDPDCMCEDDIQRKASMLARGFQFGNGPDDGGFGAQYNTTLGGYLFDKGFSDLVIGDQIAIKSGTGLSQFTSTGVKLDDGTTLNVDAVIFATGYRDAREGWKKIFGNEIIERAGPTWGIDAEGERHGQYRPIGHPGLWYAGGSFEISRWASKHLGLLIQADYRGLRQH